MNKENGWLAIANAVGLWLVALVILVCGYTVGFAVAGALALLFLAGGILALRRDDTRLLIVVWLLAAGALIWGIFATDVDAGLMDGGIVLLIAIAYPCCGVFLAAQAAYETRRRTA